MFPCSISDMLHGFIVHSIINPIVNLIAYRFSNSIVNLIVYHIFNLTIDTINLIHRPDA
mgnify:CR=1 FL=1